MYKYDKRTQDLAYYTNKQDGLVCVFDLDGNMKDLTVKAQILRIFD